jgi:hypothetical protein
MIIERIRTAATSVMRRVIPEREEGQGMAEYALILSGVALLAIVAVFNMGPRIGALLNRVSASLS